MSGMCALACGALIAFAPLGFAQPDAAADPYAMFRDIPYRDDVGRDAYADEKCRLDLYVPRDAGGFVTVVWFHAGGLTSGEKSIPAGLTEQGIAVVAPGYRLSPRVTSPVYLEDAAAAVAWVVDHIAEFGGSPERIVVSGHSAGGYLASMIALDKRWLGVHGVDADRLAGVAPVSGHTVTHFTVRAERGVPGTRAIVDDLAPQFHVRADAPPMLLITGDREKEMLGRYEENAFFWRMMQVVSHPRTSIVEIKGSDHGAVVGPAQELVVGFARQVCGVEPAGPPPDPTPTHVVEERD